MTRFGKSRKSSSPKRSLHGGVTRNPPRDILTKSLQNLRNSTGDVKKHTTKEIPYLGSAESAAIADLLNEPGTIDTSDIAAQLKDSGECLNKLAFIGYVDGVFDIMKTLLKHDQKTVLSNSFLDERVPIMVSVGISKILSEIIDDVKKMSKKTIDQSSGKTIHFVNAEDVFTHVDRQFSKVISLKSQRITDENTANIYTMLKKFDFEHVKKILNGLMNVEEKHVGGTFSVSVDLNKNQGLLNNMGTCVNNFMSGCGLDNRIKIVTDLTLVDIDATKIVLYILSVIATHVISYTFISTFDNLLRSVVDAGVKGDAVETKLKNILIHRAMVYPSMVAALDMYGLSEGTFDKEIAKEITTVNSVREVFKQAITNYDYEASAIAAKTYRHEAPKVPSFLKSPEEILQAQMKLDKMLITPKTRTNLIENKKPEFTIDNVANEKAASSANRMSALHGTWSFGRKRRSSKRRASFGRKRRSMKRRASFGRKRRSSKRRHHAVAEFGKKRRSSKRRASFGRKRRSSKRRVAEFGKRRRRHSVAKFGNDLENQLTGFGRKRRSSKRRASFGRKRRSMKRRASFGKKRRSSKRHASFGRKRRSSKRRM